jgi:hypothetical protein
MQDAIARIEREAPRAVAETVTASVSEMLGDCGFETACRRMFGPERGSRFFVAGDSVVHDEAEKICARCARKLATRNRTYDFNEHLAAKALAQAALQRMNAGLARAAE